MHLTDILTHLIDNVMSVDTLPNISLASADIPSEAYMLCWYAKLLYAIASK